MKPLIYALSILLLLPAAALAQDAGRAKHGKHALRLHPRGEPGAVIEANHRDHDDDRDDDDDDDDDEDASPRRGGRGSWGGRPDAPPRVSTSAQVKGPVALRLEVLNGDTEILAGSGNQVSVVVTDGNIPTVSLVGKGDDRLEVQFGEDEQLRSGKVRIELPRGSRVDLGSMAGDVRVQGVGGDVRLRATAGDIEVDDAAKVDIQAVEGDVTARNVKGPVRVKTVQGNAEIVSTGDPALQLEFESTAGDLEYTGACGQGCHLTASALSGDLRLNLDKRSSFELDFTSNTGELEDELHLTVEKKIKKKRFGGTAVEAKYGQGAGVVECESFSGDLILTERGR